MTLQLNYHHLRYFYAVALQGGIKAASEAYHVSAPTLSSQIRELEEFLGVQLFLREGKSLVLTDAGRMVKSYSEKIFNFGEEMLEVVKRGGTGGPETIYVGIVDAVPKLVASGLMVRAWESHPAMRVVIREGLPGELFPALAAHQLDLVISPEPAPALFKTLLFSTKCGSHGVHFVAAEALRKSYDRKRGLEDFPVLVPTRESPLRRELDRWWAEAGIQPKIRAEFDDAASMCEMAAAGAGAAPVLGPVLKDVASRYGLHELPIRTGIREDLFVITAERQFAQNGVRVIVNAAKNLSGGPPAVRASAEKAAVG